ncbi:hypothetical protein ASPVEDRAFT_788701 [Aspergillus versicolor CBS 583.65]|uniref:Uncharacterized protein n=1 Tax=Aspergillus versicolor CBS 583.65 TaxID=1036611 RepID=A0A1L9PSJ7_ASPVE|nr:uncharacterized protein ASPVEDRAFT_788701 [Aspergillus versicolor CBS 583.65]OJJ04416.1 hypothetical protein ASPVEDRAFT_788701 [Aspergillus versicolor CBS 583.65]
MSLSPSCRSDLVPNKSVHLDEVPLIRVSRFTGWIDLFASNHPRTIGFCDDTSLSASKRTIAASASVLSSFSRASCSSEPARKTALGYYPPNHGEPIHISLHSRVTGQLRIIHSHCSLRDSSCGPQENDQPFAKIYPSGLYPGAVRLNEPLGSVVRNYVGIITLRLSLLGTMQLSYLREYWICNGSPDLESKDFPNYSVHWGWFSA